MRWTAAETLTVFSYWGAEPPEVTAARVDRTVTACRRHLERQGSSSSLIRGRYTVASLAAESGYDRTTIRRALAALPSKVRRVAGPAGRKWFSLNDDQAQAVLDWLLAEGSGRFLSLKGQSTAAWSPRAGHPCCRACRTNGNAAAERHAAHGLCRSCAARARRHHLSPDGWVAHLHLLEARRQLVTTLRTHTASSPAWILGESVVVCVVCVV